MSNIINKSNHPVEIKRIGIRVWKIRDEIEAAIAKKIADNGGDANVDIEDIRKYYTRVKPKYLSPDYDPEDDEDDDDNVTPIGADGMDSSGNEMDDDALAMMAALQGGDEEESSDDSEESEAEASSEEDDEAARLAAEMLGDQGGTKDDSEKDDEAARLAAEMLGDQGTPSPSEAKSASNKSKPLNRILPAKEKISGGFALLSDLNMERIMFFSNKSFTHGQNVAIEFLIPNNFVISGEVYSCMNLNRRSNIISETKPNFRVEIDITYLWEGERTLLRDFLKSVEPEIPPPPKKMKRPDTDEEDDDEFEDLGF